jgi:hypothetical protein
VEHGAAEPGPMHDEVEFAGDDESGESGQARGRWRRGAPGRRLSQSGPRGPVPVATAR